MRQVYLDYSATTPVKKEVLDEMLPYFSEKFGNPSSLYGIGLSAKTDLNMARSKVARLIGADEREIYFTSCGTEADNWAVIGAARAKKAKGNHIITTKVEHHALLHTCEYLQKEGFEVTYLDIDKDGRISLAELENAITDKTILISIMFANNEIGSIQPIKEIAGIARKHEIWFHTDAVRPLATCPSTLRILEST
jgi:cysteine desulfurase